jgi:hypothetical protein
MKAHPWILPIVVASTLTHAAEDKPDTSRWTENFCDEAAFDSNWGAYGWLPDGKTSSRKEDRKLWWELVDGALRARTSPGVHPSGLTRKVEGTDVRVSCRFKLPPQGLVGVGFNGPNPILESNFHLAGVHIRETGITAWDETNLYPKDSPEAEALKKEKKMNRKFIGAAKVTPMEIKADVWHEFAMELRGRELTILLDGQEVLAYTTNAGDAPKTTLQFSVHSTAKEAVFGWFNEVKFERLEMKK